MALLLAQSDSFFSTPFGWAVIGAAALAALVILIIFFKYGLLYIQAALSGARVRLLDLVGMSLRKVSSHTIVNARVMSVKAGIPVETNKLEAHYLAKGNVQRVVTALIAASKAKIALSFEQAAAIDLAGRDVLDAVQTSVRPKVIDCPDPKKGRETLDSVAKDGIQLKVKARVTVRTNLERLVGGAGEDTIIARVGEGIVSSIGSAESYKNVIENPDRISKGVLDKGLDSQTAFEIVSIDIADVDVGDNVGARLRVDQADAGQADGPSGGGKAPGARRGPRTRDGRARPGESGEGHARGRRRSLSPSRRRSLRDAWA